MCSLLIARTSAMPSGLPLMSEDPMTRRQNTKAQIPSVQIFKRCESLLVGMQTSTATMENSVEIS